MRIRRKSFSFGALFWVGLCLISAFIRAELIQFTIDQTRSALTISGTFAGFAIEPQETGSFSIATTTGQTYSILASTNLTDWPEIIDQFVATNSPSERAVTLPAPLPQQYFRVRRD